ncbi:MAG: hypothetical protein A3J79_08820 [Elusimicrobia bacterium RIFOXYB2_FULL_62_6]|nr:MAG: hypothetical protein A3J79_08820 [Elusimicrobia bacterium RIFOXYB2_FULL_62_6]
MLVVAVIACLAAIAVPKFASALRNANEAATKGKLGGIRTSLAVYYADTEGTYPSDLTPLLQPGSRYLTQVVPLYTGHHGTSSDIHCLSAKDDDDSGAWGYVNAGPDIGHIWVQCTHTDLKGNAWNQY